jgi:hypothetical protein
MILKHNLSKALAAAVVSASLLAATPASSHVLSAQRAAGLGWSLETAVPFASAWYNGYGYGYYDDSGAAAAAGIMGFALGAMVAGAAAQQAQQPQAYYAPQTRYVYVDRPHRHHHRKYWHYD